MCVNTGMVATLQQFYNVDQLSDGSVGDDGYFSLTLQFIVLEKTLMMRHCKHTYVMYGCVHDVASSQKKMSILPESALLRTPPGDDKMWPILQCENIFILPGVPQYFEKKIDTMVAHFLGRSECWATRKVIFGVPGR